MIPPGRRTPLLAALAMLAAGCATVPRERAATSDGAEFAQRACAGCHAVLRGASSPNPHPPAFRDLAERRTDAQIATALVGISRAGHVEMPPIYMTPQEQAALVRYLATLRGRSA